MFNNHETLVRKSGKKGIDRPDFIRELIEEYKKSDDKDIHQQVIANLANFSYDPINFRWLKESGVIDIFLHEIKNSFGILQEFGIAGLCNLSIDYEIGQLIIRKGGISAVSSLLDSPNENCVIHAITTLIYIADHSCEKGTIDVSVVNRMKEHLTSKSNRIQNLAQIFMADHFSTFSNE